MLGFYTNFPKTLHKKASFSTSASNRRLQQLLIETVFKLNNKAFQSEEIATPSLRQCSVIFEFGIAEDNDFNYLDAQEKSTLLKTIKRKPLQIMDFLCIIRYYKTEQQKKAALRFDYYMLRVAFNKNLVEMRVFHEKGPMHMSPEEFVEFVTGKINTASSKKILKTSIS
jgi:hypothetical protein